MKLLSCLYLPAILLLSACASTDTTLSQAKDGLKDLAKQVKSVIDPGAAQYDLHPGITETELNQLFAKYPYDIKRKFSQQYPRVALTVLEAPKNHNAENYLWTEKGCFKLSAVVWDTKTKSRNIPPFHVCIPRDIVSRVAMKSASDWEGSTGFFAISQESTGLIRTNGPIPPQTPMPNDMPHQRYFVGPDIDISTLDGNMFAMTLYHLGFNWAIGEDRRVWFVSFPVAQK